MMKIKLKIIKLTLLLNLKMVLSHTIQNQTMKNQQGIVSNHKNEPKAKNKTPKQQQRAEKAKSKIDKRTFND